MSTGYLPVLGAALRHGPWVAGLCAFAVTPGALIVIALVLERRWLVPGEQFAAVAYGDPLLAVAAGLGTWLAGPRPPHGLTGPAAGVTAVVLGLLFGLAQWRDELRRGYYTPAQAVAPTKIWHQVVVYPVLGYWLWTAGIGGLSAPGGAAVWAGKALLLALTGIWVATNVYDRRHPKLGHPPFDWRRAAAAAAALGGGVADAARGARARLSGCAKFCMGWRPDGWHCATTPTRRSGPTRGRPGPPGDG